MTELERLRIKNDKLFADILVKIDKIVSDVESINKSIRKDLYEIESKVGKYKEVQP